MQDFGTNPGPARAPANARGAWPSQCEVCRQWASSRVCTTCMQRFAQPALRCICCGLRLGSTGTAPDISSATAAVTCGSCLHTPPPFFRTVCAVDYQFPWNGLITAFKFHGQPELATPLTQCMADALRASDCALPQALLPVPLAAPRLAQRGYNQAWELARRLGPAMGLPAWHDLLSRPLDTAHQAALNRQERQRNLRSAFLVEPRQRARLQGLHVALVDDVMTTGATVAEAAAELLRGGAGRVDVWVLARTPDSLSAAAATN